MVNRIEAEEQGALDVLLNDIRSRRREIETRRRVPIDIVEGLRAAGIYRAAVPKSLGGDGAPLADVLRLIERISEADPSVGWVASFAPQGANYFGALSRRRLEEIYANGPDVVGAGGLFPLQPAARVNGKLQINGRWKFGSGSTGADWISVGIVIPDGGSEPPPPRLIVLPASQVEIVENWDVVGLSGTGSHDLIVKDVMVDEDWSFIRGGPVLLDEPICHFPAMALAALSFAVVGLGAARASLDAICELAAGKMSITGAPRLGDRAYAQTGIAKAEVQLQGARALLYDQVERAWAQVAAGDAVPVEGRAMLRLAANHASRAAVDVAETCFGLAGTTAIFLDNPMQGFLRDALVVNQHAFLGEGHYESAGRVLLGMTPAPGFP
ncbi:acyl-CoA dehydrogenase family protein [Sphingopyxis sp. MSC1_008]|jgi:alkylation response protein AidB-like acyl-CoA dehydrogenase|uniref:acyl-CoA dehydrogenase family protein n=1 Tax=Sphingopyxis sp. MSC1_008 TaxID=2909265 RepID=UPI0020BFE7B8|nr:acyl-CoA dehydrogenase family protein [Sphingopyxis sp. MSC1_008]